MKEPRAFWKFVDNAGTGASVCWNWTGAFNHKGEPVSFYNLNRRRKDKKKRKGRRLDDARVMAYEFHGKMHGVLGSTQSIKMKCNNWKCVNPHHMKVSEAVEFPDIKFGWWKGKWIGDKIPQIRGHGFNQVIEYLRWINETEPKPRRDDDGSV